MYAACKFFISINIGWYWRLKYRYWNWKYSIGTTLVQFYQKKGKKPNKNETNLLSLLEDLWWCTTGRLLAALNVCNTTAFGLRAPARGRQLVRARSNRCQMRWGPVATGQRKSKGDYGAVLQLHGTTMKQVSVNSANLTSLWVLYVFFLLCFDGFLWRQSSRNFLLFVDYFNGSHFQGQILLMNMRQMMFFIRISVGRWPLRSIFGKKAKRKETTSATSTLWWRTEILLNIWKPCLTIQKDQLEWNGTGYYLSTGGACVHTRQVGGQTVPTWVLGGPEQGSYQLFWHHGWWTK